LPANRRLKRNLTIAKRKADRKASRERDEMAESFVAGIDDRIKSACERAGSIVPFLHILAKATLAARSLPTRGVG
jgi:hypothetical protein